MQGRLARLAAALVVGLLVAELPASSVVTNYSSNYVALHADGQASFVGATVTDSGAMINNNAAAAPAYESHPPYDNDAEAVVPLLLPATGAAKDHAGGDYKVVYVFGDGVSNDAMQFHLSSDVSASNAHNSIGETAKGKLSGVARAQFFIDVGFARFGAPPLASGAVAGSLEIPALAPLPTAFEALTVRVFEGAATVGTFSPGGPGGSVPVRAGSSYRVDATYDVNVPFGVDPASVYDFSIALAPEPSAALLICLPLLLRRRFRR